MSRHRANETESVFSRQLIASDQLKLTIYFGIFATEMSQVNKFGYSASMTLIKEHVVYSIIAQPTRLKFHIRFHMKYVVKNRTGQTLTFIGPRNSVVKLISGSSNLFVTSLMCIRSAVINENINVSFYPNNFTNTVTLNAFIGHT